MKSRDEQYLQFSAFALVAAVMASIFAGPFAILGVGVGLLALRHFTNKVP